MGSGIGGVEGDGTASGSPLLDRMGVRLLSLGAGRARLALEIGPEHLNRQGTLHGGVIATLLDACCGFAATPNGDAGAAVATVMLSVGFSAPVGSGRVVAEGRVIGGGRRLALAEGRVMAADGTLVATAQGSFRRSPGADAG